MSESNAEPPSIDLQVMCQTLHVPEGVLRTYLANDSTRDILNHWFLAAYGPAYGDAGVPPRLPGSVYPPETNHSNVVNLVLRYKSRFARNKPAEHWGLEDVWAWTLYQLVFRAVAPEWETPWSNREPFNIKDVRDRFEALLIVHEAILGVISLSMFPSRYHSADLLGNIGFRKTRAPDAGIDSRAEAPGKLG